MSNGIVGVNPNRYTSSVARTSKELLPVDAQIAALLAQAVADAGLSQRELAALTGMSQNRLSTILRKDPPPATVGEVGVIAVAVGTTASAVIGRAEAQASAQSAANITPITRNVRTTRDDRAEPTAEAAWESTIDHDQDHDNYDA